MGQPVDRGSGRLERRPRGGLQERQGRIVVGGVPLVVQLNDRPGHRSHMNIEPDDGFVRFDLLFEIIFINLLA